MKYFCAYCGKEFIPTKSQLQRIKKDPNINLYCSTLCRNKGIANSKRKEKPILKCAYCGKEFEASKYQFTRYNKNPKANFFCCKGHAISYGSTKVNYEERSKKVSALARDENYIIARTAKTKKTNLERYGVENPFQSEQFKQKAKQTKKDRYGDENYNNREQMLNTMEKNGFDIHAPRPDVGKKISNTWKNKSDEEKQTIKNKLSISNTKAHNEMTLSKKLEVSVKLSEAQKHRWEETSDEEKAKIFQKVFSHPNNSINVISKLNKDIANLFNITEFEFQLGKYSYDLKKDNYLIEIDPTYTHNCLQGTWYGSEPKTKEYHRDKTQYAIDNEYQCIHIFDWDNLDKIGYMFNDKQIIYARQLKIKSVPEEECNSFLNEYHLQNTCKGQIIRLGLYYKQELIEVMTFGKPRYNKNYEWELLRLCTHKDYKVVGGAEKLFKHFLNTISPSSIISYCDFSKFTGDVYLRLGFKQRGIAKPSKHWCKGTKHITDNLLRQRGYDQLFGTSYGKGTSNEELMLENGWLPIYDCGQLTFVWNR